MMIRQSFIEQKPTLYLISTPIGNLKDITLRAIETLNSVSVVFAEDTRNTLKLMSRYGIKKTIKSYHEHNKREATEQVLYHLNQGESVGLVTDAGTPAISDPGFDLVLAVKSLFPVVAVPGASAVLTALVASGLVPQPFTFIGFLDRSESRKTETLKKLSGFSHTLVFYERGDRVKKTLNTIQQVLGNRQIVLAKELTKQFETYIEGSVTDILSLDFNEKGEFVLMVEGRSDTLLSSGDMYQDVLDYIKLGYTEKEAIKKVAKDYKLPKNDVYQAVVDKGGIKQ